MIQNCPHSQLPTVTHTHGGGKFDNCEQLTTSSTTKGFPHNTKYFPLEFQRGGFRYNESKNVSKLMSEALPMLIFGQKNNL